MHRTPVLVVGGSLVGLSASLFLSMRGIAHVLVEKHAGSAPHPRAMGFTERTLELYRAAGIGERLPQAPSGHRLQRVRAGSLAGDWSDPLPWTPGRPETPASAYSPCHGAAIAQDKLEPILREAAVQRGADLRYGQRLLEWRDAEDGVVATIRDRAGGAGYELHASYLLACDGAQSPVRERLGIPRRGVGALRTLRSVLFHCPAADAYLERGVQQFLIENPRLRGFLTTYGDGRWVLMFDDDRPRSEAELGDAIRAALGSDMPFEPITTGCWEMAGRIADSYSAGRVFLLGDAAHQLPPTRGGFGANTGIDDAYNLAWKLQLVLQGTSTPSLLDSYGSERQPIGWLRHQQTFARPDYARWLESPVETELYGNAAMELGQLQRSHVILGAGAELPPAAEPDAWCGQPGTRAPHAWITRGTARLSTLDLFAQRFTLISEDPRWISAGREAARRLGFGIDIVHVGRDVRFDRPDGFTGAFGVTAHGASLVRPDGIVAWRHADGAADRGAVIADVLHRVACLRTERTDPGMADGEPGARRRWHPARPIDGRIPMPGSSVLLLSLLAASAVQADAAPGPTSEPVAACRGWIEGRAWSRQEDDPQTLIISPEAACFDGVVATGSLDALHDWIDAAGTAARPVLVVRSRGGDSETALGLAEKLEARDASVHVVGVCASACANYFYAGVRDRHVQDASLLLFHGGFSDRNRARALATLEAYLSGPQGGTVPDPEANRQAIRQSLDALQARQEALYRRVGVDPRIVHGFDELDAAALDESRCGGPSQAPRHFLYFDDAQMERLGIAAVSGRTEQDPQRVNAAIAALGAGFIACLAPEADFTGTGPRKEG